MNAKELFDLAPLGAFVKFSDGTPRPPDRFKRKLRSWVNNNNWGYFTRADPGDPKTGYSPPTFTLQQDHDVLIISTLFGLYSTKTFEVTLPKPGTILAYGDHTKAGEPVEVRHVWQDYGAARAWATGKYNTYKFASCGLKYFIVGADGKLSDHMPADARS